MTEVLKELSWQLLVCICPPVLWFKDGYLHGRYLTSVKYCDGKHTGLAYRRGYQKGERRRHADGTQVG